MEAKLKELRAAMAREKSAREGVRGLMAAGEGALWQSSRPQALRVRNGNRKLRELSAEELEAIQRAKAADIPAGSALKMVRVRSAEARRRLEPLDHSVPVAQADTGMKPAAKRGGVNGGSTAERPGSSRASSRPSSRGGVVEHVVISSQAPSGEWTGASQTYAGRDTSRRPHRPPGMPPAGGGSSRPSSSRGGRYGGSTGGFTATVSDGKEMDLEPLEPLGGVGFDLVEEMGGGGTGYVRGTGQGTYAVSEEDAAYFPPEWESSRRGGADVMSLADDSVGSGAKEHTRVTNGGVSIVDESQRGGSLLDGEFDEAANEASFAEALKEWRNAGRTDPDRPTTASLATMEVQTEAPFRAGTARPQTARPGAVTKAGASYFERMYAANVERMAAKDAMDTLRKRPGTGRPMSARPGSARSDPAAGL